jgi:hypothetical protein
LTVSYTVSGTAENGADYEKLPGSIEIPAGKRSARILVQPIDDKIAERIETVVLRLSPSGTDPQTYALGMLQTARAIIIDNDQTVAPNARVAGENIHFHFDAPKGMRYRIETSDDLANWRPVCSNVAGDTGASVIEDATAGAGQFYRLIPETSDFDAE